MKKTPIVVLAFFVVLKFALQFYLLNPVYELHRDEYLHIDQGKHLAWGYLSVPPITSWFSYLILHLGNESFWVKFFPALFGAITILIVWYTVKFLGGRLFAKILAATALTFSVILRINTLYQPNSFEIMIWTALFYSLIRFLKNKNGNWLLLAGTITGIAFLNKYNVIFLLLGLIPSVIITGDWKLFPIKKLLQAVLLTLVIISPNLYWQYEHHFVVFHHLSTLAKTQLIHVNRFDFLKEQLFFFIGSFFVLVAALISFFSYPPFKPYKVLCWNLIFTLFIFTYLKAKGYYAIGLYPIFFAFGAVYLERIFLAKGGIILRPFSIAIPVLVFLAIVKVLMPVNSPEQISKNDSKYRSLGLLRWEDGKDHAIPQDFADMIGWKELAHKVDSCYDLISDREHTAVLCDNYGQAGAINYYSKYKNINAVTQNADYIDWYNLDEPITSVISVKTFGDKDSTRSNEIPYFETIRYFDCIENPFAREKGTNIFLFLKPKVSINDILEKEIGENKQKERE